MQKFGIYEQRLERVKEVLKIVRHAAVATVNADGSPHNTPVFATFDDVNFYWASGQDTQHSQNIARDGRVFVVVFDSLQKGGGLYIQARAKMLEGDALEAGLRTINANRQRWGREQIAREFYESTNPQRLYKARPTQLWVNMTEYDANGEVTKEYRHEIKAEDLQ